MPRAGPRKVQRYSLEFKRKAVALSQLPDVEVQAVADALEIHPFMLSRWRKQAREGTLRGTGAVPTTAPKMKTPPARTPPTRLANCSPTTAVWRSPSARASYRPVCRPGGPTTTRRLARPSLVNDGASATSWNWNTSTKHRTRRTQRL